MAKFEFDNSTYAKLWNSQDFKYIQTFIDEAALLRANYGFWKSQMSVSPDIIPTASDGTAAAIIKSVSKQLSPMMDMRDRLGDSIPLDKEGEMWYTANIADFIAPGIVENALERHQREQKFAEFGNDALLVSQWVDKLQTLYDSGNATMSNMTAQIISTGKIIYNFGRGINSPLFKAEIPAENFKTAGSKIWAASDCLILDQMATIEQDWRESKFGEGPLKWQIPYDMFYNVFMKNAQIKTFISDQRYLNGQATTAGMVFTADDILKYISLYPAISPIEIIVEKQNNLTWSGASTVHGWASNIAVLRPTGLAGQVIHTDILDTQLSKKYGSSMVTKTYAIIDEIFNVVNTTLNNGNYKEWHTDLMMSAVPTLNEFPNHIIVDTATADS